MTTGKKVTIAIIALAVVLSLITINMLLSGDETADSVYVADSSAPVVNSADFSVNDGFTDSNGSGAETFAPVIEERPQSASDDELSDDNNPSSQPENENKSSNIEDMILVYNDPSDFEKINYRNDAIVVELNGGSFDGDYDYFQRNGLLDNYKSHTLISGGWGTNIKYLLELETSMTNEELNDYMNLWKDKSSKTLQNAYLASVDYKIPVAEETVRPIVVTEAW
ncbi:MAG: hypothetical protein FWG90_01980 [Oscillospiraceae bacterium]|nr:hypothetical protein [Oscillospiraceae bacterium]